MSGSSASERPGAASRRRQRPPNTILTRLNRTEQSVFGFGGKDVQPEALGDLPAHPDTQDAVAVSIEPRREDGDAPLTGYDGHDATADAALGGDAHVEGPLTGGVVHAAGVHNAKHFSDVVEGKRLPSGQGVHAAVRQRRCHYREILAGDAHRALPQVEGEDRLDVPREHAVAAHEVGRGSVTVRSSHLGFEGVFVYREAFIAGIDSKSVQYAFELLGRVAAPYQVGGHERPGVDHGVVRAIVPLVEDDGVESVPAGLYPDMLQDVVSSVVRQCQAVNEHLRDGLQGERSVVIAGLVGIALSADDTDAESVALLGGKLWLVVPSPRQVVARDALFT